METKCFCVVRGEPCSGAGTFLVFAIEKGENVSCQAFETLICETHAGNVVEDMLGRKRGLVGVQSIN